VQTSVVKGLRPSFNPSCASGSYRFTDVNGEWRNLPCCTIPRLPYGISGAFGFGHGTPMSYTFPHPFLSILTLSSHPITVSREAKGEVFKVGLCDLYRTGCMGGTLGKLNGIGNSIAK